ncbi:hypothetical protein CLOM_g13494 [Closterium sp. NIES-68]|nr:hypothetical protein CLOM_g13494 [Closterium sp. NIES-68]GJP86707.1 hypothetical protein CLOP_g16704 [Closterium sp. NIES-67]
MRASNPLWSLLLAAAILLNNAYAQPEDATNVLASVTSAEASASAPAPAPSSEASPSLPAAGDLTADFGALPADAMRQSFIGGPADLTAVSRKNCSLSVQTEVGSNWEFENCVYLQSGGGFTFHWTYDRPTRILDGAFSADWEGWVGWGIGVRMVGASAIVAFRSGESGYYVSRYLLADYNATLIKPDTGELSVVANSIKVHIQGPTVRVMFAVALPEEQTPGLYIIMAKGEGGDPATGALEPHSPFNTARTYLRLAGAGPPQWLQAAHGLVNLLAWGLLLPIGMLLARHLPQLDPSTASSSSSSSSAPPSSSFPFPSTSAVVATGPGAPSWVKLHRAVQAGGYALGAFGFFLGLLMWGDAHEGHVRLRGVGGEEAGEFDPGVHRRYGITLFVLASFQVTALMVIPHKDALLRPWWNLLHHWNGRVVVLLGVINVWHGISLLHPHSMVWSFLYGIPFGLLLILASLLEAFTLWKWLMDDAPTTSFQRWVQSMVPPHMHRRYMSLHQGAESASPVELSDGEIEFMASKFRQELEYKYM